MLFLLAVSAQAQSYYGGGGNTYLAGTPAGYSGLQSPQSYYAPPAATPVPNSNAFDLSQSNLQVQAARYTARGNNLFYNTPYSTLFPNVDVTGSPYNYGGFLQYGNYLKARGNQIDEHRFDRAIDQYRATHQPMTYADRNAVDDLILQRNTARDQKLRRASALTGATIPGSGASVSAFFDRRSQQSNVQLAQNSLFDARNAYGTDPSRDNVVALRNARDNLDQADYRRDATTFDLLGNAFGGAGRLGPVLRKKASQEKLDVGYRNLRIAQDAFAKDPSIDNRLNLKLANLFVRATAQEDDANDDDILVASAFPLGSIRGLAAGMIASSKNFQDEADLWLKYNKLQRFILIRKQQKALQDSNSNPVAQQMLGLQDYGPNQGSDAATRYPNNRATLSGSSSSSSS